MPVDLTTAKAMLEKWLEAEAAVAVNQAYEVAGTKVTRADLHEFRMSSGDIISNSLKNKP